MRGWLVNDRLTAIPGTRTLWHQLLATLDLTDKTKGTYDGLAESIEYDAAQRAPDYIIRNAAYFRRLDVQCPVVSFVQDILTDMQRDLLVDACGASQLIVFNSAYTRLQYPELHSLPYRIIPIGTDETIFRPKNTERTDAVLWVGSGHPVKGFGLARLLAHESVRPWVFVMKDATIVEEAHETYRYIPQEKLAEIAATCAVGVCTSIEETQHLAGIEMGMCGLPLVTSNVGVYYERNDGPWGERARVDWFGAIERSAKRDRIDAAAYWRIEGFGLAECQGAWRDAIATLEVANVDG